VTVTPASYEQLPWWPEAGPTAVEPFPDDTSYFGTAWMINFRVRDLVAMVTQLRAADGQVVGEARPSQKHPLPRI
jgi:glyoxylase I family protein